MELKWQQAFHSVRPLPPQETAGATSEGWTQRNTWSQSHQEHACASTGTHTNMQVRIYITIIAKAQLRITNLLIYLENFPKEQLNKNKKPCEVCIWKWIKRHWSSCYVASVRAIMSLGIKQISISKAALQLWVSYSLKKNILITSTRALTILFVVGSHWGVGVV